MLNLTKDQRNTFNKIAFYIELLTPKQNSYKGKWLVKLFTVIYFWSFEVTIC